MAAQGVLNELAINVLRVYISVHLSNTYHEKIGSSTVCDGNGQKNGKKSKTGLKKTGIAPIVY